jgi:antitoxin HigA-1
MTEYTAKPNPKRCPTHPGAVLREDMVPASGKKKVEIARLLGISRQHLHDIMEEKKPLSPEVAVRVGSCSAAVRAFGFGCRRLTIHGTLSAMST